MKILILGGYGVFGGRLAELLRDEHGLEILIAGRSYAKAAALCKRLKGQAVLTPIVADRGSIEETLIAQHPDILIDASGPFQIYGARPYHAVKACIAAGVNYLDLADGADFVRGISRFDDDAKKAGVFALSGVSSCPALTSAVLREISKEMTVRSVQGGIAPSPYAGVGLNVIRAVTSYAGAPIALRRAGQNGTAYGLTESIRYTVAVPGKLPLRNLHFSLVDVPDLQLLPEEYPQMDNIWMGAGPIPEWLHRLLNLLAKARAARLLPKLTPLAPLFHRILNLVVTGEHRGGMFIDAHGEKDGKAQQQSWHLVAEGDDGPYIPSMASAIIVRKAMAKDIPMRGARPAMAALTLSEFSNVFAERDIHFGMRSAVTADMPLYPRVMGDAFNKLSPQVRKLHDHNGAREWYGHARVRRGRNPIGRLLGWIIGFPAANPCCEVTVRFAPDDKGELWTRDFGGRKFSSYQYAGQGHDAHLIVERFGPIAVSMAMLEQDGRLTLIPRRWTFLNLPLPRILMPGGVFCESDKGGEFQFDVTIKVPMLGLIAAYKGTLKPRIVALKPDPQPQPQLAR